MIANVNEQMWIDFGLDSAVFLDTIAYWLKTNASNKQPRNFREGRYWTYNTLDALHTMFPGWSRDTIRGIIRKCVKNGLLIVGNFNKKKYDRTCWYTLTDKALEYYSALWLIIKQKADNPGGDSCGDLTTPSGEIPTPIPKLLPSSSINTNTTNSESVDSSSAASKNKSKPNVDLRQLINIYAKWFPDNPQPHKKTITNELEKVLRTLIKRWPEAHPDGLPFTPEQFEQYMKLLSSDARKFSKGSYLTKSGVTKKNGMVTFCRWDNFIKFLEGAYS